MAKGEGTARAQARQVLEEQRRRRVRQQGFVAAGIAVALVATAVVAMAIVKITGDDEPVVLPSGAAAAEVISQVTGVPPEVLDRVGKGEVGRLPVAIEDVPALTVGDLPLVLYVGAEFCPFCASQRWAVVVALSRFGTFTGLGLTYSASDDVYPNTQSLTFHGATFTSEYLVFQGVETATNVRQGSGYEPLDSLTPQQHQVMQTLNAPPYVEQRAAGSIPFMAIGNRYLVDGGSYSPEVLKGKSVTEIASAVGDPSTAIATGIVGTANAMTTAICVLTGNRPGEVCNGAAAKAYASALR